MTKLLLEPHYLGSLEYYSLIVNYDALVLEVNDRFQKQTFRNRCHFLGANKVLTMIVPVSYNHDTLLKDVTIDNHQRWKKDHWGAFYSSYGKAPFFEYFADSFKKVWDGKHKFLIDLSIEFLKLTFEFLQMDVKMTLSKNISENEDNDFRNFFTPKKSFTHRKIYQPRPYTQLFGDNFEPNLSITDLIMNEGPQARSILSASFLKS